MAVPHKLPFWSIMNHYHWYTIDQYHLPLSVIIHHENSQYKPFFFTKKKRLNHPLHPGDPGPLSWLLCTCRCTPATRPRDGWSLVWTLFVLFAYHWIQSTDISMFQLLLDLGHVWRWNSNLRVFTDIKGFEPPELASQTTHVRFQWYRLISLPNPQFLAHMGHPLLSVLWSMF